MSDNDARMSEVLPLAFHLSQNYPNPFRKSTTIKYCVGYRTRVRLMVLNSAGALVDTLVDEEKDPGTYRIDFTTGVGASGEARELAHGKYSYRLEAGEYSSEKEMELLHPFP
jgi:hypothetical protein